MRTRIIRSEDKKYIKDLLHSTAAFTEDEIVVALELIDDYLLNASTTYRIFIAEDELNENKIKGYICYGKAPLSYATFEVYWIAVDKTLHNKGIGKFLMHHVEKEVRKQNGQVILVETSSKPSYATTRKFYESMGYSQIAIIEDYYAPGDNRLIFSKRL